MRGSGLRNLNLTNIPWFDVNPSWSPDGQRIAFQRGRGNWAEIYVMNADGSGVRRLTRTAAPGFDAFPVWSPNGRQIAFIKVVVTSRPWLVPQDHPK